MKKIILLILIVCICILTGCNKSQINEPKQETFLLPLKEQFFEEPKVQKDTVVIKKQKEKKENNGLIEEEEKNNNLIEEENYVENVVTEEYIEDVPVEEYVEDTSYKEDIAPIEEQENNVSIQEEKNNSADINNSNLTQQSGVNYYDGRTETYYSSNALYHKDTDQWTVDDEGFYRTDEGYYVVAASDMPQGTTFEGSKGTCIVLDSGCDEGTTDYYVSWS